MKVMWFEYIFEQAIQLKLKPGQLGKISYVGRKQFYFLYSFLLFSPPYFLHIILLLDITGKRSG